MKLSPAEISNIIKVASQSINPSSPNIHKQILQTGLHTFRYRMSW